jgi:hypothetical protein
MVLLAKTHERRARVIALSVLWGPFLFLLGLHALYNYMRFDSFFEFGQLLVFWPSGSVRNIPRYTPYNLYAGLHDYFFGWPQFSTTFPYVSMAGDCSVGLFVISPFSALVAVALGLPQMPSSWKKPTIRNTVWALSIFAFLTTSLVSWARGGGAHNLRYEGDFAPLFLFAATVAWLAFLQNRSIAVWARRIVIAVGILLIVYGCLINNALTMDSRERQFYRQNPTGYRRVEAFCNAIAMRLGIK